MQSIGKRLQQFQQTSKAAEPVVQDAPSTEYGETARKACTRRLVQLGALTDQYLNTVDLTLEDAAQLLLRLAQLPDVQAAMQGFRQLR